MSDQPGYPSVPHAGERHAGPPFKIERVLGSTVKTFTANVVPFLAIAALLESPVVLLNVLARGEMEPGKPPHLSAAFYGSLVLGMVAHYLVTGTLVYGVFKHLRGQRFTWSECLARGLSKLPAAFATALLVGLATGVGFILCFVPGIYVLVVYAVAVPAAVVEGNGTSAAMARSKRLTTGHGWPLLGTLMLVWLLMSLPSFVITFAFLDSPLVQVLCNSAWQVVAVAVQAVLSCVIYYQLRETEEDLDAPELAAVFD